VVTTTATSSATVLPLGIHTWTVRAFNEAGYSDWATPWTVEITQTPPCTQVTGVNLTIVTTGTIYAGDTVAFQADIVPDGATRPYTYTVYLDGTTLVYPQEGIADPLTFSHTFPFTGSYVVEVAVWNCGMTEPVTGTVQMNVYEPGTCVEAEAVDLSLLTLGEVHPGDSVSFSADLAPDDATLPYSYTLDWGDGASAITATASADPLGLSHVYTVTGRFMAWIAVWNCGMFPEEALSDTLAVSVVTPAYAVYLPVVLRND